MIWGWCCLVRKQFTKGALYLASEILIILYMVRSGLYNLSKLITLGELEQQKIWNEAKSLYEYVDGDRSLTILLYGIVTVVALVCAVLLACMSIKSAYKAEVTFRSGKRVPDIRTEVRDQFDKNLHTTLLSLPILGVLAFTILPLLFMTSMAFTNYSVIGNKLVLFDWVGLNNFKRMVDLNGSLGQTFWPVLGSDCHLLQLHPGHSAFRVHQLEGNPGQEVLAVLLCADGGRAPLRHPDDHPADAPAHRRCKRAAAELGMD